MPCAPQQWLNDPNLERIRGTASTVPVVTAAFDTALCSSSSRGEPAVEMLTDEVVVVELRIPGINPGDFLELAGAECLVGIKAPDAFEQSLAAQDFVQTGGAAGKMIGGVEERGV